MDALRNTRSKAHMGKRQHRYTQDQDQMIEWNSFDLFSAAYSGIDGTAFENHSFLAGGTQPLTTTVLIKYGGTCNALLLFNIKCSTSRHSELCEMMHTIDNRSTHSLP